MSTYFRFDPDSNDVGVGQMLAADFRTRLKQGLLDVEPGQAPGDDRHSLDTFLARVVANARQEGSAETHAVRNEYEQRNQRAWDKSFAAALTTLFMNEGPASDALQIERAAAVADAMMKERQSRAVAAAKGMR